MRHLLLALLVMFVIDVIGKLCWLSGVIPPRTKGWVAADVAFGFILIVWILNVLR